MVDAAVAQCNLLPEHGMFRRLLANGGPAPDRVPRQRAVKRVMKVDAGRKGHGEKSTLSHPSRPADLWPAARHLSGVLGTNAWTGVWVVQTVEYAAPALLRLPSRLDYGAIEGGPLRGGPTVGRGPRVVDTIRVDSRLAF